MMNNRRYLAVDTFLYKRNRVRSECFSQSRIRSSEIIEPTRHKVSDLLFESFFADETQQPVLNKPEHLIEGGIVNHVVESPVKQLVHLLVNEAFDCLGGLFAFQHSGDEFREAILQSSDGIEYRRACL